jgi:hypothetical protein
LVIVCGSPVPAAPKTVLMLIGWVALLLLVLLLEGDCQGVPTKYASTTTC